ncbi:DUF397 domain-containing protein [Streptomyces sp. URMC 123]|uniref:DUF397 domain-containing protein n=1 Tax=Streptomyces sp. URMC 123 TaxID=3423403 RepID=UPI003F1C0564
MSQLRWQKSSFSEGGTDTCVEVAVDTWGTPHLRESDQPSTVLVTTPETFIAFLCAVKTGTFDHSAL